MRRLITFFAVIALTNASVLYRLNELGSYDGSIARQEIRTADGVVRGTYTYIDGDGETKTIQYGGGNEDNAVLKKVPALVEKQQIESSLPTQEMGEEVVESLSEGQDQEKEKSVEVSGSTPALPEPVTYTPEVAAARAAHFAARDQAIYLQQGPSSQQPLFSPQIVEYSPFIREYYGAAKHYRTVNPYYGYLL